jgi:anti-sigma regulatory factor (Ser/Thr protein kinase)
MTMAPTSGQRTQISRQGRMEHLADLLHFVDSACKAAGIDSETAFDVHLAVEEVCANIIRHGYGDRSPGPIELTFSSGNGRAIVTIIDEARPFLPADAPPPDLDSDWEERQVGGLGWHLTHSVMDEVNHHARPGGGNRLTLVKHLQSR